MSKVYVIGAKDTDIERIRELTESAKDDEIILIEDMSQIPMAERSMKPLVNEIYPIIPTPHFEPHFFSDNKRKGHESPYKYHR